MDDLTDEAAHEVVGFDVLDDVTVGEGGFLRLRRLRLRAVRADGSRSREGTYDFVERPHGLDAVVVALYHRRDDGQVEVLLRRGIRPPITFGRPDSPTVARGRTQPPVFVTEVVAGVIERGEESEPAIRERAAAEALEEAGVVIAPDDLERLGGPSYASAGMCAEQLHFTACEVRDPRAARRPVGDGSPFEEGAKIVWVPLDEALRRCNSGLIEDQKTEIALRRLDDHLRMRR
jgi:ADP-ribose pyrophosphatase